LCLGRAKCSRFVGGIKINPYICLRFVAKGNVAVHAFVLKWINANIMKRILFILCLCVLGFSNIMAQEIVTGTVVDKDNVPVPGARVEIVGRAEYAVTDIDGSFRIELPVTAEKLQVSYPGFPTIVRKIKPDIVIKLGKGWGANAKGYRGFFDFYGGFGFGGKVNVVAGDLSVTGIKNFFSMGIGTTHGYQINPHLYVGVGVGLMMNVVSCYESGYYEYDYPEGFYFDLNTVTIPLYADVRWDFGLTQKTAPFVGVKVGYQIGIVPDDYDIFEAYKGSNSYWNELGVSCGDVNGFLFQPTIGMRTSIGGKRGINIALSYNISLRKKLTARYVHGNYIDYDNITEVKELGTSSGGVLMLNFGFDF